MAVCDTVGRVIGMLPRGESVVGVTSLDNRLYVLRLKETSDKIEVYDIDTFHIQHRLTVRRLGRPGDIVACGHNRCAYISDNTYQCILKLALPDATVTHWPVNDLPTGLSLTVTHGVLVTCTVVRKIKEFSTDGQLLHQLTLPEDVASLIGRSPLLAREHGTVYLLLSAPLRHTTSSKKTLNLTFLDYHSHCDNCVF